MSQFLFDFVKSLSMREKAYFKRYVTIYTSDSNKNYLKVYDAIERMDDFQKGDLQNHFKGTSIEKYLSSEISYLKNKLLTSLTNFHANSSPKNKMQKGILFIEILLAKGFRKEAMKKLKYFKKMAYHQEEFSIVLKLIELEEDIFFQEGIVGFKDVLKKLKVERNAITQAIQNLNNLRLLRAEIRELQFSEGFITDNFKKHKEFYKNPILESEDACLSIKAKGCWYYIHAVKFFLLRNYHDAVKVSQAYVLFQEQHLNLFPISKQLPPISNLIYYSAKVNNQSAFKMGISKLDKIAKNPQIDLTYIKYIKFSRQLEIDYISNDIKKHKKTLALSIELIANKSEQMGKVQVTYLLMLIVRATIVLGKYELGVEQINHWIQVGVFKYLAIHARLFSLILHYQLGWDQLISSEIFLLKKMIKAHPKENDTINAFYDFFKDELKSPNQRKNHTIALQKRLKEISMDNQRNFVFDDFDFYKWSLSLPIG